MTAEAPPAAQNDGYGTSSPGLLAIADRDRIEVNNAESGGIPSHSRPLRQNGGAPRRALSLTVVVTCSSGPDRCARSGLAGLGFDVGEIPVAPP